MPPALELALCPVPGRAGHFAADLDGRRVLAASRQPYFDAGRVFQVEDVPPGTAFTAHHAGSAVVAMRFTVGEAAALTVEETDDRGLRLRRWRPHPKAVCGGAGEPQNARSDAAGGDELADA